MVMIRSAQGWFHARGAVVLGDVTIGPDSSLWFNVVIRGDVAPVVIGRAVNVQDNSVIHCDRGVANVIEDRVTIGHGALVHGAMVGEGSLIGMGSRLLGRTRIGRECIVAAGAVVPPGMEVPDRMLAMGVPARIVRRVTEDELAYMRDVAARYVELAKRHVNGEFLNRSAV